MTTFPNISVSLENVGVSRGDTVLFEGLSFEVNSGDVVWIHGSNGIGKTTLLRLITGLSKPEEGEMKWTLEGQSCRASDIATYQAHRDAFKPNLTAKDELSFWANIYGYTSDLNTTFERVSLSDKHSLETRVLSAGQRRRLAIARLLISQKPLWVMDEPAAAMDAAGRELIYNIISLHANNGGAVVLASHESAAQLGVRTKRLTLSSQVCIS